MQVRVDRDTVAQGDDAVSHRRDLEFDSSVTIGRLVAQVPPDATIGGGRATWLITAGAASTPSSRAARRPIGVYAQEWRAARFFGPASATLRELAGGADVLSVHFDYLAQVDPEIVFDRCRRGGSLSPEERSRLTGQRLAQVAESDAILAERASAARYLSDETLTALDHFGFAIRVHSGRYLSGDLPTSDGPIDVIVDAHDSMAGVSLNGEYLAYFRPLLHAEQFIIVQLGDIWRRSCGRQPAVLPAPTAGTVVEPVRHGNRCFFHWTQGPIRHDATFGLHQELAERFARYAPLPLSAVVAAYLD